MDYSKWMEILAVLRDAKQDHLRDTSNDTIDSSNCCAKSEDDDAECECGADEFNARVDKAIRHIEGMLP